MVLLALNLDIIRTDGGTQTRTSINTATVEDYANDIEAGDTFPPVVVFHDGTAYWLADGFHRYEAHKHLGYAALCAEVHQGTQRDALLYSAGANRDHGLRRTNEDKRRAVIMLLRDDEWVAWSNREIARQCGVSLDLVNRIRSELSERFVQIEADTPVNGSQIERIVERNGTTYTMTIKPDTRGAKQVERLADIAPELVEPVLSLEIDLRDAKTLAAQPEDIRAEVLEKVRSGESKNVKNAMREVKRDQPITVPVIPQGSYNVIYADPPWQYDNTGVHGAANHHYPTMKTDALCDFLASINLKVATNAALFMWVTNPLLPDALRVIDAWRFDYKTNLVWVKTELEKPGLGFYVRGRHELLLICTRGSFTPLDKNISPPIGSVLESPVREHSRKPDAIYSIIETLYPGCQYVELFARQQHEGWDAHGNELG